MWVREREREKGRKEREGVLCKGKSRERDSVVRWINLGIGDSYKSWDYEIMKI